MNVKKGNKPTNDRVSYKERQNKLNKLADDYDNHPDNINKNKFCRSRYHSPKRERGMPIENFLTKRGYIVACKSCNTKGNKYNKSVTKEKKKEYNETYVNKPGNKEKIQGILQEYREDNKELLKTKALTYYHENADSINKNRRDKYPEIKDDLNEKRRENYAENPEPQKERSKKYYNLHKDEINKDKRLVRSIKKEYDDIDLYQYD